MILKGHLDPWRLVDKWGYRLQRREVRRSSWILSGNPGPSMPLNLIALNGIPY